AQETVFAPEESVYSIVNGNDSAEGMATLINAERGIFLTASHVVSNANTMFIRRGNIKVKFKVLLRGNNIARAVEDWALIQADPNDWKPYNIRQPLNLIYDLPNAADLTNGVILSAPNKSSNFAASQWAEGQDGVQPCTVDSVILAQTAKYDKGFSGAAVYVRAAKRGVFAITSRFQTDGTPADSETIQLFAKVSKAIQEERGDDSPIDFDVLRDLLKDHIFVKMVPVKCIIDQIIAQDTLRTRMFETEESAQVEAIETAITNYMPESVADKDRLAKVLEIMNAIGRLDNFSVVNALQVLDTFVRTFKNSKKTMDEVKFLLFASITQKSQTIYAYNLPAAYIRASTVETGEALPVLVSNIVPSTSGMPAEASGVVKDFVDRNASWKLDTTATHVNFDTASLPSTDLRPEENLAVGTAISKILSDNKLKEIMTPETKALVQGSAVIYLANGLNNAPLLDESKVLATSDDATLNAMATLGQVLVDAEGVKVADVFDPTRNVTIGERLISSKYGQIAERQLYRMLTEGGAAVEMTPDARLSGSQFQLPQMQFHQIPQIQLPAVGGSEIPAVR
ncbi:hypothetical protein, partial [Rhizobium bangladeshense]|uniref:hypothetical protein n=1 Tax=Rhizobium bangladeshense TaxID=1138189 RepID=UPI000AF525CD